MCIRQSSKYMYFYPAKHKHSTPQQSYNSYRQIIRKASIRKTIENQRKNLHNIINPQGELQNIHIKLKYQYEHLDRWEIKNILIFLMDNIQDCGFIDRIIEWRICQVLFQKIQGKDSFWWSGQENVIELFKIVKGMAKVRRDFLACLAAYKHQIQELIFRFYDNWNFLQIAAWIMEQIDKISQDTISKHTIANEQSQNTKQLQNFLNNLYLQYIVHPFLQCYQQTIHFKEDKLFVSRAITLNKISLYLFNSLKQDKLLNSNGHFIEGLIICLHFIANSKIQQPMQIDVQDCKEIELVTNEENNNQLHISIFEQLKVELLFFTIKNLTLFSLLDKVTINFLQQILQKLLKTNQYRINIVIEILTKLLYEQVALSDEQIEQIAAMRPDLSAKLKKIILDDQI